MFSNNTDSNMTGVTIVFYEDVRFTHAVRRFGKAIESIQVRGIYEDVRFIRDEFPHYNLERFEAATDRGLRMGYGIRHETPTIHKSSQPRWREYHTRR